MTFKIINFSNIAIDYLLIIIAFLLPINTHIAVIGLNFLMFFWLLSGNWINLFSTLKKNYSFIILVGFWLLHVISLLYSSDISRGLSDIQMKLSFILFPLVFVTLINKDELLRRKIIISFLLGLLLTGLYLFLRAFLKSISIENGIVFNPHPIDVPWDSFFWYQQFSSPRHPTYLAMYYTFGLAIVFWFIKYKHLLSFRYIFYLLIPFYLLIIFLLSSRVGIFTSAIILLFCFLWLLIRKTSILKQIILFLFVASLLGIFALNNTRFLMLLNGLEIGNRISIIDSSMLEKKAIDNSLIRIQIWKSIPDVVGKNWVVGTGVGDTKRVLTDEYEWRELKYAYEKELNTHNQFLETFVGLGIIGLVVILLLFLLPLLESLKKKDYLYFLFLLILIINLMFESLFERIAGTIFFSFFFSLFSIEMKDSKNVK